MKKSSVNNNTAKNFKILHSFARDNQTAEMNNDAEGFAFNDNNTRNVSHVPSTTNKCENNVFSAATDFVIGNTKSSSYITEFIKHYMQNVADQLTAAHYDFGEVFNTDYIENTHEYN